ncbi:MAG: hypothetical protein FWD83_00360 [Promicromonosporaceae bacterium]|nr:hypothetical protein [Promicromonosporaceae bacterium]
METRPEREALLRIAAGDVLATPASEIDSIKSKIAIKLRQGGGWVTIDTIPYGHKPAMKRDLLISHGTAITIEHPIDFN